MKVINFSEKMYDAVEKWNTAEERDLKHEAEYSRYNGGWVKKITGLDKSKNNGYSLLGDFVKVGDFDSPVSAGLYFDCSIGGSRKNQERNYHLVLVDDEGEIEIIEALHDAGFKYAPHFWSFIEAELGDNANNVEADPVLLQKKVEELERKLKFVTALQHDLDDANAKLAVCEKFMHELGVESGVNIDRDGSRVCWIKLGDVCVKSKI